MVDNIKRLLWKRKYLFLFFSLFIILLTQRFLNERQNGLANSIATDGLGYYCYLPAAVIYQDFAYHYYDNEQNKINPIYRPAINQYKDKGVNKYYCGTAICMLPFFLIGIVISAVAGTDINGYTDTFLMMISLGSLIYCVLSVFLISRIAEFFSISAKISFATCLVFLFGTNFFHYVIQEPSMSHVYSFFAVSLFFYLFVRLIEKPTNKALFFLGLAFALVALIRPVNVVIILFTPFFFAGFKDYVLFLKTIFIKQYIGVAIFIVTFMGAVLLQFTFYYLQTGDFYIVSYEGETFNFAHPEIINMLFSYKKGLFIYTPLILAAILFILFVKSDWFKKVVFFTTLSVFIYITASWWCWWYGGGFSIRPIIDILPLFVIFSMLLYSKLSIGKKRMVLGLVIPFLLLNQLMAFQYSNGIMHSYNMDKEKFWDIFLETNLTDINQKKIAKILTGRPVFKTELMNYEDTEGDNRVVPGGYQSQKASVVGKMNHYSKGFGFPLKDLNLNATFYLIIECMAKTSKEGKDLALVASVDDSGNMTKWDVVFKNQFSSKNNEWVKMTHVVEIDKFLITGTSYLKIFANTSKGDNLVDDLKYTIVKK
ncbi:MAG: hypothetical protein HY062_07630 [Bacteroidetes bacterium]|nr:hypothetical protein [Bacteroidota bacterium]